jgi:hypothetical protein
MGRLLKFGAACAIGEVFAPIRIGGIGPVGGSRTKSGFENLNGAGTPVSEKVHLDEIAVTPDGDVFRRAA